MNCYQKFYTNQIHSSSLLCQLATMWKSQVLCDAIIRSGNVITKAHRVVLVAACPMLQSMENAAVGSHLEVRLASDIKQGSIHTFLQYLYEGFMMLTEENCKDVEKIARLLQVDSVIKCCADFYKCLSTKTGNTDLNDPYKYTFHDMVEFRHVRSSDLQKMNQDRMTKRGPDFPRPSSPGGKRQRMNRPGSPPSETVTIDDTVSMSNSYNSSIPDPWERVPRLGTPPMARQNVASKPGVVEVVEDSLELIQTEPPNASGNRPNERRSSQKSVSIAVSSQIKSNTDLQIVNVSDSSTRSRPPDPSSSVNTSQSSITVSPLTLLSEMSTPVLSTAPSILPTVSSPRTSEVFHVSTPQQPTPHVSRPPVTSLPFAAGSAAQSGTQYPPLTVQRSQSQTQGSSSKNESFERVTTSDTYEKGAEKISARPNISNDKAPDISIVKIESDDENTGLDMYVDMPDESEAKLQKRLEQQDDGSDTEHDTLDWSREHMSSEDNGHMNSEQNAWFMGQQQYKDFGTASTQGQGHVSTFPELGSDVGDQLHHRLVRLATRNRTCAYCGLSKNKTKSGSARKSYFKCEACNVPLCQKSDCFSEYHKLVKQHGGIPVTQRTYCNIMRRSWENKHSPSSYSVLESHGTQKIDDNIRPFL